eukprot:Blabericola_migrator_1__3449@NODE_2017_length_3414_cov_95_709292_g165_i1_p1_GENE_NODE_2017_length_3414_cov_95_709292_g165_i1NODE_2017_length_3414_cov_95_709292_g165_i1_p1_ORF_typecomplete_len1088_score114_58TSP_1/PF00090_19/7_4e08TSP_1/PF00090_19/1_3e11TSP_1/PF00090_19/4_8e10TSP_1/PF00090_19/2_6e08TSP_1/PF00090_19/3_5e09TSP_1/PF00090_19/8e09TSP_1/PF00090_19/91TSP_1/PF00090_19/3_8e10TSP_1/PF00090_19/5_3e07TSP_1/PF00090_19/8_4e11TSP_1/PF00090_19/8_3e09TSP_1/PF00090_19/1_6e11TSP_1/PF00090_19/1_8e11
MDQLKMPVRIQATLVATIALLCQSGQPVDAARSNRRSARSTDLYSTQPEENVNILPEFVPLRQLRPPNRRDRLASSPSQTSAQDEALLPTVAVNAAGFKCEDSALVEAAGTKCSLLAKSFGPLGCQRVLSDLAAERGKSLEGVPQAFRNRRVADACPESCGLCDLCAPGCAKWFIGNGWCEPQCNVKACQWDGGDCWETDCVVGPWSDYSACSISCDPNAPHGKGGYQTRTRQVKTKNSSKGKACPPLEDKKYGCNANIACPVECEVSEWGEWSSCSAECGVGESIRTRKVLRPPANGALHCPELKQKQPCFLKECESPCEVSEWSEWQPCSSPCGGGSHIRTRSVLLSPVGANTTCPVLVDEKPCNTHPCPRAASECELSEWSDFTECSSPCGGDGVMVRSRTVLNPEICKDVSSALLREVKACNEFPCVTDCLTTEWSEWSECSTACGEGRQYRRREIAVTPSETGEPCGLLEESRRCYSEPCPVSCQVSSWSPWSECSIVDSSEGCGSGHKMRSRSIVTMPRNGGDPCPELVEFEPCEKPCSPDGKCHLSQDKSDWTNCNDDCQVEGLTHQPRSRRHSLIGIWSPQCSSLEDEEFETCADTECDLRPEDCLVGQWSTWSACTVQCGGGGVRHRFREVLRPAASGGRACPLVRETEPCGTLPCPTNCEMGPWMQWSHCSSDCGMGTKMRSRVITKAPSGVGALPCGSVTQVAPCFGEEGVCPMDCLVSEWSDWSACSQSCGGGLSRRQRRITQHPVGGTCPDLEETRVCNPDPCPVDCLLSDWTEWTVCDVSCDNQQGQRMRMRSVIKEASMGGAECAGDLVETATCHGDTPCEKSCELGDWTPWSTCSAPCGEGVSTRKRLIKTPNARPEECPGAVTQTVPCFIKSCSVDCEVSPWTEFDECSVECGGGEQKRTRDIVVPAANGGVPCPPLWDIQPCNTEPCLDINTADCVMSEWNEWSRCTQECGGGITTRTRHVEKAPGPGGKACGSLKETKGCNLQRCPDVTCADNPRIEEQGITCQILKTQGCVTNLVELAKTHGVELPNGIPPEARVQDACPMTCGVCAGEVLLWGHIRTLFLRVRARL